jgi:two-component system sensor histidine kinase CpxA
MAGRITTLVTAERRLLQDVSHELRSPLARLRFAVQISRRAEDREDSAVQVDREIGRLSELVGALMQVTRVEGDASSHRSEPVELAPLVEAILEDCAYEARERGCRLVPSLEVSPVVCGDLELLRRAIENVVENAIRYAPPGSAVELDLAVHGQSALISIRDYGPGVPEEDLTRIFTPFFRVDPARDRATGGVGLGLAIVMRAVTLHHGGLRAENAHPGLRVILDLPRLAESPKS